MLRAPSVVFSITCLTLTACSRAPAVDGAGTGASARTETTARRRAPGVNPFDFESGPLAARVMDYVLVPSKSAIDAAFERGFEQQTFVYLGAHLEELNEKESRVRWSTSQQATVPNALIVPIRHGERAIARDIVLTSWASGAGLQRAVVIPGGSPEAPKVRYLDLPTEGPMAPEPDTLPKNTFHVLREPSEVGSTIACGPSDRRERLIVVKRIGDRALALGFAGKMRVVELPGCAALPLVPAARAGDRVFVPNLGRFVAAKVESVDTTAGRVLARFDFGGEVRQTAVGYTNVAFDLTP